MASPVLALSPLETFEVYESPRRTGDGIGFAELSRMGRGSRRPTRHCQAPLRLLCHTGWCGTPSHSEKEMPMQVKDYMCTQVTTVTPEALVSTAFQLMTLRGSRIRHLPVVTDQNVLVGILTD